MPPASCNMELGGASEGETDGMDRARDDVGACDDVGGATEGLGGATEGLGGATEGLGGARNGLGGAKLYGGTCNATLNGGGAGALSVWRKSAC